MKCDDIQVLLSRHLRGELKPSQIEAVDRHLAECSACREWMALHRSLDAALDRPVALPPRLQERALLRAQTAKKRWWTQLLGDPKMRKLMISSTSLAAVAACLFILFPRPASAETPAQAFENIGSIFAEAASRGDIVVYVKGNGDGTVKVRATHNGGPLPPTFPLETKVTRVDEKIIDVEVTLSFKPDQYSVIRYGENENTLELIPKSNPNQKIYIELDPKTRVPVIWTTCNLIDGRWVMTTTALKNLKMSDRKDPARIIGKPTIRMYVDQEAQVQFTIGG